MHFRRANHDAAQAFPAKCASRLVKRLSSRLALLGVDCAPRLTGDGVTKTIKGAIIDLKDFNGQPDTLMVRTLSCAGSAARPLCVSCRLTHRASAAGHAVRPGGVLAVGEQRITARDGSLDLS
jgi:hypothetical protein